MEETSETGLQAYIAHFTLHICLDESAIRGLEAVYTLLLAHRTLRSSVMTRFSSLHTRQPAVALCAVPEKAGRAESPVRSANDDACLDDILLVLVATAAQRRVEEEDALREWGMQPLVILDEDGACAPRAHVAPFVRVVSKMPRQAFESFVPLRCEDAEAQQREWQDPRRPRGTC